MLPLSSRHMLILLNDPWSFSTYDLSHQRMYSLLLYKSSIITSSAVFPNQISFDLWAAERVFTCDGFHFGKTNEKSLSTWRNIWKIVCGCDLYALQDFYPGLPLIKLTDKRKHLLLCRVQTFLHLPSPSCIRKDAAERLIQPSCLSGSGSISSAARLSSHHLCAFLIQYGYMHRYIWKHP